MNPWAALAALILWVASIAGSFLYGDMVGTNKEKVKQTEIKQAIEDTRENARQGAASEIAKIKFKNTTIQGRLVTEIRDNPVYRDCVQSPVGLQLINEAITGKPTSGTRRNGSDSVPGTLTTP